MLKVNSQTLNILAASAHPERRGFLLFTKSDIFASSFQKKWFVLNGNILFYFKDEDTVRSIHTDLMRSKSRPPQGCIILERAAILSKQPDSPDFVIGLSLGVVEGSVL